MARKTGAAYDEEQYYQECERLDGLDAGYEREYNRLISIGKRLGYRIPRKVKGLDVATQYVAPRDTWTNGKAYTNRYGEPIVKAVAIVVRQAGEESEAVRRERADLDYSLLNMRKAKEEHELAIDQFVKEVWAGKYDGVRRVNDGTELTTEQLLGPNMYEEEMKQMGQRRKATKK